MGTSAELGFAVSVHVRMNRMSEPENASIIALLEPASAVVFAAIILSQPITSTIVVGGGLIMVGALVVSGAGAVGARA